MLFHLCSFPRLDVHDPDTRGRLMDRIDQAIEELALDRCKCPRYTIVFTTAGDWRRHRRLHGPHQAQLPAVPDQLRLHDRQGVQAAAPKDAPERNRMTTL